MNIFKRQQNPPEITLNTVLSGRYKLLELLGEGGAGVVYKATDQQLKRTVAIKVLTEEAGMSGNKMDRFISEARSVARLNHPNIITLYDYAEEHGRPYLVMEYVPGQDLWALDNSYAPKLMPFEMSLTIINDILSALNYSHQNEVIHRDLKPENVMVTPQKQTKVMDFGLARIQGQSRLTKAGLVAGTASYLAPELALGDPGDHRADLYALGVIIYELTTGRRPFNDSDPLTVISQHIHAPVVPPKHFNEAIPDRLQRIIMTLLAKDPEERYQSAADTQRDFAPVLAFIRGEIDRPATTAVQTTINKRHSTPIPTHQELLERIARGKMIGREAQLTELKNRWDMVLYGEHTDEPFVLLAGEGGIGKTRLLKELEVYTKLRKGYVLKDTARQQDVGVPYSMFANALEGYINSQPAHVLQRQMTGFIPGEVVKLVPRLTDKIGYIPPNPPLKPEAERARLLEQISHLVLNLAYEQPTLLLVDDLQFADHGSLDILEAIVRQAPDASLLIVGAYRNVGLSYGSPINRTITALSSENLIYGIPLRRLSRDMTEQMLETLLGNDVTDPFVEGIYQATEGNPLYIEEVVKGLVINGQIILTEGGHWEQRDKEWLYIPSSLKSVIGSRLERVSSACLKLLQLAATIGRNFTFEWLARADYKAQKEVQELLTEALQAQLIEHESNSSTKEQRYQFQHAIVRETLYDELRPLRRRQLHRRLASALEGLLNEGPKINPATVADHLVKSAQDEKAVSYLCQAGESALQIHANEQAIESLSQAREILEDLAPELLGEALRNNLVKQFDILSQERQILNLMGDRKRELQALEALQDVTQALEDDVLWVKVLSRMATYYWQTGRLEKSLEVAHKGLEIARQHHDERGESQCLEQIARVLWTQRNPDSMTYATEALTIVQALDERERQAQLTTLVGNIYADMLHDTKRAAIYFDQALKICRETNNRMEEAWTLWGLGRLALFVDDYERALTRYEEAKKIATNIGATLQTGWDLYHLGDIWYNLGDYKQALDNYEQAQIIFNDSNHQRGKIYSLISLGLVFSVTERHEEANTYLEQAMRRAEERNDNSLMFRSYQALATHYITLGNQENLMTAIRLSNRTIKLAREENYIEHELLGHYLRGLGFFTIGNIQQAHKSSKIAVDLTAELGHIHSPQITAAEVLFQHSKVLRKLDEPQKADEILQRAYDETMRKAKLISDASRRQNFLANVKLNQQILNAYQPA